MALSAQLGYDELLKLYNLVKRFVLVRMSEKYTTF